MVADLREGWDYFRRTTWLWVVVLAFGFLNAMHLGAVFTLGPVVAKDTIGAQGWGLVLSAESVGLLLMTLVLLRVPLQRPLLLGMIGIAALGLPMAMLGADPPGSPHGVRSSSREPAPRSSHRLVAGHAGELPEPMMSRAWSYDSLGSFVAIPVGQLAYGPLGAAFGYEQVLVVSGIAYVAISLLTLLSRSVRDLPRRQELDEPSGQPAA